MKHIICFISFWILSSVTVLKAGVIDDSSRFAIRDTIKEPLVRILAFDSKYFVPHLSSYDTIVDDFQKYLPLYRNTKYPIHLGIIGQAASSLSYFDISEPVDYLFLKPSSLTFFNHNNATFYNTRRAYSKMRFIGSANQMEAFNAILTQNMTKEWNIGVELDFNGAKGAIKNQKTGTHQFRAFSTYYGSRYSCVGQYSVNRLFAEENGGIITGTDYRVSGLLTELGNVNLPNAKSVTRYREIYTRQEFNLSGRYIKPDSTKVDFWEFPLSLGHVFTADRAYRKFDENFSTNGINSSFYKNIGINPIKTLDSVLQSTITNTIFLKKSIGNKQLSGIVAGAGMEMENHQTNFKKHTETNNVFGIASLNTKSFKNQNIDINTKYFISGRKKLNIETSGLYSNLFPNIDSSKIEVKLTSYIKTPAYFYNEFISNHFSWNNTNINKEKKIQGMLSFNTKNKRFGCKAGVASITDYIYVNDDITIKQYNKTILIHSIELSHKNSWGPVTIANNFLYQQASSIIQVPLFSSVNTLYLKGQIFNKILRFKTGVDLMFWTSYFTPAYMPELGMFYTQTKTKHGNYPYLDAFLQVDIKRIQAFVKYSHISYYANMSDDFFAIDNYPLEKPTLSFGLSWYFYN